MDKRIWNKSAKALLSVGLVASLWLPGSQMMVQAATPASDLFISEYIEGSSLNKAIEIYNGTGASIELSPYSVALYANGSTSVKSEMALSGTVPSGETLVLYHSDADLVIQSKGNLPNTSVINFNGDDALVLEKDGAPIDSIGQVGARIEYAKDVTLVRNPDIQAGDSVMDDAFDPSTEWIAYPINTFEHLGNHTMNKYGETPVPPKENKAPATTKVFAGEQLSTGDSLQYDLTEYFSDPEGQSLSFSSTKGTITESTLTLSLPEGSHIVGVTASDGNQSVTQSFSVSVSAEATATDDYYEAANGLQGTALKAELHEIIDNHR